MKLTKMSVLITVLCAMICGGASSSSFAATSETLVLQFINVPAQGNLAIGETDGDLVSASFADPVLLRLDVATVSSPTDVRLLVTGTGLPEITFTLGEGGAFWADEFDLDLASFGATIRDLDGSQFDFELRASPGTFGGITSASPASLTLIFTAVPEPSTSAVIFGALALGAVGLRRRRKS